MRYVLAPLAGFTNAAFRRVATHFGADLTYTEMVSAAGLAHGSSPTRQLMEVLPGEGPVACQIFGANPEELAFATREAAALRTAEGLPRFCEINLNAGCPMRNIVHEGSGAALLVNPEKVQNCLRAMVREAGDIPVTLKTRPGPRRDCVLLTELLSAAESAGARGFILHARFTSQMHGGSVHLDLLADLVSRAHIPITGNGSVVDVETAREMAATGVETIMIGRAAVTRPWIFAELKDLLPCDSEAIAGRQAEAFRRHFAALEELRAQLLERFPNDHIPKEDAFLSLALHTHLFRYFNGRPGAAALRKYLNLIRTREEILTVAREAFEPAEM